MSCTDSDNFPEPQIIKIDSSDDKITIAGKPCIDFQPDDRWQIKDEEGSDKVISNSSNECNANGRQSRKLQNSKSHESNSSVNGEALESDSDNESDNTSENTDKLKEVPKVVENHSKRKRHNSESETMPDCNTKKKVKVDDSNEHSDVQKCSLNDDSKTVSKESSDNSTEKNTMPDLSPANTNASDNLEENTKEIKDEAIIIECNSEMKESTGLQDVTESSSAKIKVVSSDEKDKAVSSDEKDKAASSDEKDKAASSDEKDKAASSVEKDKAASSDEKDKTESNAEKDKVVSCDEKNKSASSDEKDKVASSDEKDKATSSDEKDKAASSDEKNKAVSSDEKGKAASSDEKGKAASSDEKGKAASSDEKDKAASSDEKDKAGVSDVKDKTEENDCEVIPTVGKVKKANHSKNDVDIEIININDDKKSDSGESDSEIQIIMPRAEIIKKATSDLFKNESQDTHYTLTAGFPYYNSLKEKINNFKAGDYKPVKFPHTGTLFLGENEVIIESPSLLVPLLIKESDEFPKLDSEEKKSNGDESAVVSRPNISKRNFFQSSVGQFLINLGMSRVQEWYHRDMKKSKLKQLKSPKGRDDPELEQILKKHDKRHEELKEINAPFNFRLHPCKFCEFKSESLIVIEGHYLIPHISPRREYKCNFCDFISKDPGAIAQHYEKDHRKKAVLDYFIPFHECVFCTFQSHLKNKVNAHMNRCRKHFIPSQNLSPPFDFEFPGVTTKPVTINDVIGHRRLLLSSAKNPRMPMQEDNSPNAIYARKKLASVLTKLSGPNAYDLKNPSLMKQLMAPQSQMSLSGSNLQLPPGLVITRPRGQVPPVRAPVGRFQGPRALQPIRGVPPRRGPPYTTNITSAASQLASSGISITPVTKPNAGPIRPNTAPGTKNVTLTPISTATNRTVSQKPGPPQPVALFTNMAGSGTMLGQPQARLPANMHLRPIRPSPPYQRLNTPPSQVVKGSSGNTFVVCEICDSYIKDLEELRTHMNWVHKVKIHPKMLVSRPPLNCQKCHWRFFTDQGLERHLLGAHGLVTTNMQEMANKNQDGGRCIICGAVFTYKLVSHMTQVHKVTLKPAHLSYKCTVCTATFTLYRLFESHVYNVHSGSAKRSAEDSSSSSEPAAKKLAVADTGPRKCKDCGVVTENMHDHLIKLHIKNCVVKLCRIEKCEKCLNSSDEMLVIRMSDFGLDDELDDSDEDSSEEDSSEENEEAGDDSSVKVTEETGDNSLNNTEDSAETGDQNEKKSEVKEDKEPVTS